MHQLFQCRWFKITLRPQWNEHVHGIYWWLPLRMDRRLARECTIMITSCSEYHNGTSTEIISTAINNVANKHGSDFFHKGPYIYLRCSYWLNIDALQDSLSSYGAMSGDLCCWSPTSGNGWSYSQTTNKIDDMQGSTSCGVFRHSQEWSWCEHINILKIHRGPRCNMMKNYILMRFWNRTSYN